MQEEVYHCRKKGLISISVQGSQKPSRRVVVAVLGPEDADELTILLHSQMAEKHLHAHEHTGSKLR